jgi:hypothetical protein
MKKLTLLLIFALTFIGAMNAQVVRYVKPNSSGSGDGSSWTNA